MSLKWLEFRLSRLSWGGLPLERLREAEMITLFMRHYISSVLSKGVSQGQLMVLSGDNFLGL